MTSTDTIAPACENCMFYLRYHCVRYPPTVVVKDAGGYSEIVSTYPNVERYEWCGEHKPQPTDNDHPN